jgi:hypothetical protein
MVAGDRQAQVSEACGEREGMLAVFICVGLRRDFALGPCDSVRQNGF